MEADVKVKAHNGATALFEAVSGGHYEAVRLLLDYGAEIEAKATLFSTRRWFWRL